MEHHIRRAERNLRRAERDMRRAERFIAGRERIMRQGLWHVFCSETGIMLKINLRNIAKERNIDRLYSYLVYIGLPHKAATNWATGKVKHANLNYLELICSRMKCEPHDVLEWTPEKEDKSLLNSHPLKKLLPKPEITDVKYVMRMLPKEDLDELLLEIKKRQDKLLGPNAKMKGVDFVDRIIKPKRKRKYYDEGTGRIVEEP
jgi:DNA-binding Xre family transcriptional regulator